MSIRLIATDLDGTLLGDDGAVSPRTRAALDAARDAGIATIPVTARQPIGLRPIAAQAGFTDWALCGNGAYGVHLTTGEHLFAAARRAGADCPERRPAAGGYPPWQVTSGRMYVR